MTANCISRAKAMCIVALAGGVGQMFGALIVVDDPQYGASSIVRDTATGLEWLGLFKTAGLSYNTVFSNLGTGGTFAGFRYANLDEVGTLFADAGIPDIDQTTSANFVPVFDLLQKIGTLVYRFIKTFPLGFVCRYTESWQVNLAVPT